MTSPATAPPDLPSPPFLAVPGIQNFRDTGGYPVSSAPNKIVRRGVLFRAAEPSQVTPEGISRMRELGIKHVYDLRSVREFEKEGHARPPREWEGAERIFAPVFLDQDYSPEAVALRFRSYASGPEGFKAAYMSILRAASAPENTKQPYASILSRLASATETPPAPLLVHCTAGKDRTGVICALVLSLCGVADDVVAHEYSLTALGLREMQESIIERLKTTEEAFRDNPEGARGMVVAVKENMLTTLEHINQTYGSVEKCVLELGLLTPESLAQLRKNMIVDETEADASGLVVDWKEHAKMLL
ncbi:tyrosine phosphatase family-domain-containing protein [Microdochium trichocladiopsis]|uniref:Tyrosine phosphatase family-domain-containing protein n=1 Tax=Microdochium trichocladiopsis TaxID=1682393 RepID=A0A9P8Y8L5_9PEZI|nr:tyrosine phosphatase family-domain-containing protein [Microdochium trichocladiopsis]KAH7032706.1 tyrosine phosphatase family-domain-containing protein [Microdochium trichocladiopsis]